MFTNKYTENQKVSLFSKLFFRARFLSKEAWVCAVGFCADSLLKNEHPTEPQKPRTTLHSYQRAEGCGKITGKTALSKKAERGCGA